MKRNPPGSFQNTENCRTKYLHKADNDRHPQRQHDRDDNSEQTITSPEHNSIYSVTKYATDDRLKGENYNSTLGDKFGRECEKNQITYISSSNYNQDNYNTIPNKRIMYQNQMYDMAKNSSYICQPISTKKDVVRINDVIVKDNFILSCKPRTYNERHSPYIRSSVVETGNIDSHIHPQTEEELRGDNISEERNYTNSYKETKYQQHKDLGLGGSTLVRSDNFDLGTSAFLQDNFDQNKSDGLERLVQCTKIGRKFKGYLWVLFFINIFILIVGLILLIYTLVHIISRNYINIVIEQTGFVIWVIVVMILSICIITVGIYGIMTSIDRGKRKLTVYCITGFILTLLILAFLILLWIMFINMKSIKHSSMRNTFKLYRCNRYIRNAWDDLQEKYKCCGIEDIQDWKYIPRSCCNAIDKEDKQDCKNLFIDEYLAFKRGCKSKLEDYFTFFFTLIGCLLLLALILLFLGMFVSFWLRKKYKKIVNCLEVYHITR